MQASDTTSDKPGLDVRKILSNLHRPRLGRRAALDVHQRNATGMLMALGDTGKHVYPGTVPAAVKARRRAKNRAARKARRAGR